MDVYRRERNSERHPFAGGDEASVATPGRGAEDTGSRQVDGGGVLSYHPHVPR